MTSIPMPMLVTIQTYRDLMDAQVDKGYLESQGIKCRLQNEDLVAANWLWSQAMGGVQLQVHPNHAEKALGLLGEKPLAA